MLSRPSGLPSALHEALCISQQQRRVCMQEHYCGPRSSTILLFIMENCLIAPFATVVPSSSAIIQAWHRTWKNTDSCHEVSQIPVRAF